MFQSINKRDKIASVKSPKGKKRKKQKGKIDHKIK